MTLDNIIGLIFAPIAAALAFEVFLSVRSMFAARGHERTTEFMAGVKDFTPVG